MWGIVEQPENHESVFACLHEELASVERRFQRQLDMDIPPVGRLCRYIERYRGKMLRPTITILSGLAAAANVIKQQRLDGTVIPNSKRLPRTSSAKPEPSRRLQPQTAPRSSETASPSVSDLRHYIGESHLVLAAVTEMVHMATLVHDDVLDEAEMRRRGATVNYLHGNEAAVLLGDLLISNAFHLCSTLGRPELNERIGAVTNSMCAGELLQLHHRNDWSLDAATYYEIINRKTASLIGVCCELGAAESGADAGIACALGEYGRKLGMAFQIQDDLLDLIGDEFIVGKSLGRDLEKRKLTLPIILYFQTVSPSEREDTLALLGTTNGDSDRAGTESRTIESSTGRSPSSQATESSLRARLAESGAIQQAHAEATRLVNEAKDELRLLRPSPALDLLREMAISVVARKF